MPAGSDTAPGDFAITECHTGRARAKRIGRQVQPALSKPSGELRLPVLLVGQARHVDRRDSHERGVSALSLAQAYPAKLLAHRPRTQRRAQVRPAVEAWSEALHIVGRYPVRHRHAAKGYRHARAYHVKRQPPVRVHPPLRASRCDDVLDRRGGAHRDAHPGPGSHAGPSWSLSPARCACVTRGNSTGVASTCPATTGPAASNAGAAAPRVSTAIGHSRTRSAPTSAAAFASGKRVCSPGRSPAESASARNWESIVPASQYTCRKPRSRYRHPVRHGTPVTMSAG